MSEHNRTRHSSLKSSVVTVEMETLEDVVYEVFHQPGFM